MATHQRSREAILGGAKIVIAEVGSYESNLVNIAARAEISRATIYNHFADREEMMMGIVEAEINRLTEVAMSAESKVEDMKMATLLQENDPTPTGHFLAIEHDGNKWNIIDLPDQDKLDK